jgi:hypothetical protein
MGRPSGGGDPRLTGPLGLAFNVLAVRRAVATRWLVAGNLSVLSGILALWHVPRDDHELFAARSDHGAFVLRINARWYQVEHDRNSNWAWCGSTGGLELANWPAGNREICVRLAVRGLTPRLLEIQQDGRSLWHGTVGTAIVWIDLPAVKLNVGRARLELSSPAAPVPESTGPDARRLGFAIYGVKLP